MADLPDVDEMPATGSRELHDWLLDAEERAANRFADEFASVVVRAARAYRSTLVAAGDVSVFDSISTARLTAVLVGAMEDTWAVGAVASMGASGLPAVLTAPWAASVNETAVSYASTATNRVRGLAEESWLEVRGRLVDGLEAGMPNREFAAQVSDISGYGRGRAEAIARTEMVGAYNAGHEIGAEALPTEFAPAAKQWLATGGSRTRESHAMANGQVVAWGDTFTVGGSSMSRPHDPAGPAAEIVNCVIGSTQVEWPGQQVGAVTRRAYHGDFVKLVTARGHNLTVTPNHPILAPTGYVPADSLRPGQHVLATDAPPSPQVDDGPPSIEEVQRAALDGGSPVRVRGSVVDFHGDGADAEVEVVRADRGLSLDVDPEFGREVDEPILVGRYSGSGGGSTLGRPDDGSVALRARRRGNDAGSSRLVSGAREGSTLDGGHALHPELVRFAGAADGESEFVEASDDGRSADAEVVAHLEDAVAAGMSACEVVEVNRFTGSHDVFNLSTSDEWYIGNGIAQHNCRCTLLVLYPGDPNIPDNLRSLG